MERPTLNDPAEYKIIKNIYFNKDENLSEDIDSLEKLERQESRYKNNLKSSR